MKKALTIILAYAILACIIVFAIMCPWAGVIYLITTCVCALGWFIALGRKVEIQRVCERMAQDLKQANTQLGESLMQCQVLYAMLPIDEKDKHEELNPEKEEEKSEDEQDGVRTMEE